jgi:flagellar motor protein MotB
MNNSDKKSQNSDDLEADTSGEVISTVAAQNEHNPVYNKQSELEYQQIESYLKQLDKLLNRGQHGQKQINLEPDELYQLSRESRESKTEKEEPQFSGTTTVINDKSVKQSQSIQLPESEETSGDLKSLETAGILDELLERFSGEAGDRESVQYQELLEQLALDRTDPKTLKEVNELLNRLTDQRSTENPENPEKYFSENPENAENPQAYISGNGETGGNGDRDRDRNGSNLNITEYMNSLEEQPGASKTTGNFLFSLFSNLSSQGSVDSPKKPKIASGRFWGFSLGMMMMILVSWGIYQYVKTTQHDIEKQVTKVLKASPELAFYRIEPDVRGKILFLTGKLPSANLRDQAATIARLAAPDLVLENQIIVIDQPANMMQIAAEVENVVEILNQIDGINISAKFERGNVVLEGTSIQHLNIKNITQVFAQIPGVIQVDNQIKIQPVSIGIRIYFKHNSADIPTGDWEGKILQIKELIQKYPNLNVKIIGYSDQSEFSHEVLALKRSQAVENLLEDMGIDRRRIKPVAGKGYPPDVALDQEKWLRRCVIFEIIQGDLDSSINQ